MENVTSYPRSFLARNHEPLVKSYWSFKPEFREHPLMIKFQELIQKNHTRITETVDIYQRRIEEIKQRISKMPRCFDVLPLMRQRNSKLPTPSNYEKKWNEIMDEFSGLGSQLDVMKDLVSSMDSLFVSISE